MPQKSKDEQLTELRDISLFLFDYYDKVYGEQLMKAIRGLRDVVLHTYQTGNLSGMKMIVRDLREMARGQNKAQLTEMNVLMMERFGWNFDTDAEMKKVKAIIRKKSIKTQKEYQLLLTYFEEIQGEPENDQDADMINEILVEYQDRTGTI